MQHILTTTIFMFCIFGCVIAEDANVQDRESRIRLPKSDAHYKPVAEYIEVPDADYKHASEAAYEAFRDIKYSVRIHWGVYALYGGEASWGYLAATNSEKAKYNELYKQFNPKDFNADDWMVWFKQSGMQAFAFTTKHGDGFSMYHTKTKVKSRMNFAKAEPQDSKKIENEAAIIEPCDLYYSIEESPYQKDIVKELCDAARKNGIKINLYYTHPDWYDADFRPYCYHPLQNVPRTAEETKRMVERHREQLRELLTNYGKIDMVCLDMWLGKDIWQDTKETVKMMRQLQSDVMIRARGIGHYGDYYQPEQNYSTGLAASEKDATEMPWMSIKTLGNIFSYDPVVEHYKGSAWVIHNLIETVAKGGSFMVSIGPDANGKFHPEAVRQLNAVGDWLKVNGKGIYETRPCNTWGQDGWYFTRSKDKKRYYAFTEKWFGSDVADNVLTIPHQGTSQSTVIRLLGYDKLLQWKPIQGGGLTVEIPADLKAPCKYAWGFEITQ
ncbi:alpha-L-fucosidase [Planctomycetales bacterium]|nr:alpha-L-fucosidase [Planctomycetales bacterium]